MENDMTDTGSRRRVTIREVAERAGVSMATASRATSRAVPWRNGVLSPRRGTWSHKCRRSLTVQPEISAEASASEA